MADTRFTQPNAQLTQESFLADRMDFWGRVTGATVKTRISGNRQERRSSKRGPPLDFDEHAYHNI